MHWRNGKKLKFCKKYEAIRDAQDSIGLMKLIKYICYNSQDVKYAPSEIHSFMEKFINCKQSEDMSDKIYSDKHNYAMRALKQIWIFINVSELITNQEHGDIKA